VKTNVISLVGRDLYLSFLLPHGRILPAGATLTIDGDLRSALAGGGGARYSRKTEIAGMQGCIDRGEICVKQIDEEPCSSSSSSSV
jgi:hypothetical protein